MYLNNKLKIIIFIIILTGLVIRFININQSLWLDEAIVIQAVRVYSLFDLLTKHMVGEFHPPLYYILMWFWVRVFGASELSVRIPSILAGIGLIVLFLNFIKDNLKSDKLILSVLFFSTSPLLFYYSQEARMYMLAAMFGLWSMTAFWRMVNGEQRQIKWYEISTILMFLTHYTVWFLWIVQLAWLWTYKRNKINQLLPILLLPLIALVANLPLLIFQIKNGLVVSQSMPIWEQLSAVSVKNLILFPVKFISGHISVDSLIIGPLVLICLGIWLYIVIVPIFLHGVKKVNAYQGLLWLWLVIPVIIGFILSYKIPMLSYFRFLYIIPAFHLLLIEYLQEKSLVIYKYSIGLLIIINIFFVGNYIYIKTNQREDWKGVMSYIRKYDDTSQVVIIKAVSAPFDYYNQTGIQTIDYTDIESIKYNSHIWLVTYSQPIFDPDNLTETIILEQYGFELIDFKYFNGDIGIKYYFNPKGQFANNI